MKKRKLMIQVSALLVAFFLAGGVLAALLVYKSATRTYLSAKNDMITRDIEAVRKTTISNSGINWFFDFAYDHYDEIKASVDLENNAWSDLIERENLGDSIYYDPEVVYNAIEKSSSYEEKVKIASSIYSTLKYQMDYDSNSYGYGNMFLISADSEHSGFVYYQADDYGGVDGLIDGESEPFYVGMKLGDRLDLDSDESSALGKISLGKSDQTEFEIYTGQIGDLKYQSHYMAFCPIVFKGRTQAALVIDYNWNEFRESLINSILIMLVLMFAGIIVICGVIILQLRRIAVKPLAQLQGAVKEYSRSKDSARAVDIIGRIKAKNEIGVLADDVSALAVEIDSYMKENMKLVGERERVAAEMELAAKLQADMLPSVYPAFPDRQEFDVYATMTPAKEVGGDFYDFFLVDNDHLALAIADVSGKGIPAALFMMMSKILIQNFAMMGLPPATVLEKTNEIICRNNEEEMFVTVWFGIMEISTGRITAVNAGHEFPIIRTAGGDYEILKDKHGMAVGGMPGLRYKEYEIQLEKGGALFLYTDGLPEAQNTDEEMFGMNRLVEVLNKHKDKMPVDVLAEVRNEVNSYVGEAEQFDDLTMLEITLI